MRKSSSSWAASGPLTHAQVAGLVYDLDVNRPNEDDAIWEFDYLA